MPLVNDWPVPAWLGWLSDLIARYNAAVSGYMRFGSGWGLLVGAIWAIDGTRRNRVYTRYVVALLAGLVAGGRLMMILTSSPVHVLVAAGAFAAVCLAYVRINAAAPRFRPLPRLFLKGQPVK